MGGAFIEGYVFKRKIFHLKLEKIQKYCDPAITRLRLVDINLAPKGDTPFLFWGESYLCQKVFVSLSVCLIVTFATDF